MSAPTLSSAVSVSRSRPAVHPLVHGVRRLLVWGGRLLLVLYFAAALLILVGRHLVLPEIAGYRGAIEQQLTQSIGLPVTLTALSAEWPGWYPRLLIEGLQIHDQAGRPALAFDRVEAEVGWSSLWRLGLHLHRLEIVAPALDIRRDSAGVVFVAGLPLQSGNTRSGFADWLLTQGRIVVRDARIVWHDALRAAPPLELQHLNLDLKNAGRHHSLGLVAEPASALASRLDLRGNLLGHDLSDLSSWRGELYVDVDQTDLAAWSPWLDLPLELTQGQGGLRLWLTFENRLPTGFTADLRLTDVAVRLQPALPVLALKHLHGRLRGQDTGGGYVGEIQRLELATQDGIVVAPTDARLTLKVGAGVTAGGVDNVISRDDSTGEFRANGLDLGALAALASHLPLPPTVHERLKTFAPRGRLADLVLNWRGALAAPTTWQVKGRFDDLALAAYRELPGFSGISGSLAGDEQAGQVRLDSQNVQIKLPTVFPDQVLALASLVAEAGWQVETTPDQPGKQIDLLLSRIAFTNHDARGELSGRYRYTGQGPGEIDLSAKLSHGVGNAVWRYLPLVVNKETREWLRTSIVGGRSDNTTLRLKGPLAQFPFRDNQGGIFQVKGTFRGATLKYADAWPEITGIDGDLLFEGVHMLIRGQRGTIMGAALSEVRAEIADLEVTEELLSVSGRAKGATQQFLDFIEASPVGARIDHFTQAMRADGKGELDLKLTLPLRHITDTQVQGRFRFADNQLQVVPALPEFTAAHGEFSFSADRMQAQNLRARLLGMPLTLDVTSAPGGAVHVLASGTLAAQTLRQTADLPVFDHLFNHLSGETPWRASVTVKKPGADIRVDSSLEGLASSLPEPFNKSVRTPLPLSVTGRMALHGDTWQATLGDAASLRLQQSGAQWRGRIELGAAAVNAAGPLPARGVAVHMAQPTLDVDAWRNLLNGLADSNANDRGNAAIPFEFAAIDLKSAELQLLGRRFHDVALSAARNTTRWRIDLASREAQGQLNWDGRGAGRIAGHLSHLTIPAGDKPGTAPESGAPDPTQELPAVDLLIDNFRLRDMALGELRLAAENREGAWQATLAVKNAAAQLNGAGRWRPSRTAPETTLNFKLDVTDAETLLARLGLPDAVRRGTAQLDGDVSWAGSPLGLDLASLSGQLAIKAEKGQFKKLEPGVGRLLGVLSLQSLPRRITLDFRDVFSEGFAFDSIAGTASIRRGLMQTDGLNIRGPAAKVRLSGRADLMAETQELTVRVQPAVGETIAVGAMIANPVVGAVAWLAQKVLDDPLDQAFAFEYAISGPWSEPKVEKLTRNPAEQKPASP